MEKRTVRFPIMLTDQEDAAIQKFRFRNHIGTKAEAARALIEKGLEKVSEENAATGTEFGDRPAAADSEHPDLEINDVRNCI